MPDPPLPPMSQVAQAIVDRHLPNPYSNFEYDNFEYDNEFRGFSLNPNQVGLIFFHNFCRGIARAANQPVDLLLKEVWKTEKAQRLFKEAVANHDRVMLTVIVNYAKLFLPKELLDSIDLTWIDPELDLIWIDPELDLTWIDPEPN